MSAQGPNNVAQPPFILNIPELQSRCSSPEGTRLRGLNEQPEQSVLIERRTNPNSKIKAGRRAPRPVKNSPCSRFRITKKVASTFARSRGSKSTIIGKEILEAITDATDQYFEQLSNDLCVFAEHAGRKNINENDVIAVMRR